MLLNEHRYYKFVREERLFCAVLAHFLMQQGTNLQAFLNLVNAKSPNSPLSTEALETSEFYIEFAFLRDYWKVLGKDNGAKRDFIFQLLSRVDSLSSLQSGDFPSNVLEFNQFFIGNRAKALNYDIAYPGRWSVATLSERFSRQSEKDQFRDFCRFKWAFNIKPDLVLLTPGNRPLCIEAKLESREGWYPTIHVEAKIFDKVFGPEQGRVNQLEEQSFMFDRLLGSLCQLVLIGKKPPQASNEALFLSWTEVFEKLNSGPSTPFVRKLLEENLPLNGSHE